MADNKYTTKVKVTITVNKKYKEQFDEIASKDQLKFSTIMDELLREWLKKKRKEI